MEESDCADAGSGGLDALFANQRKINLSLPAYDENGHAANMDFLIRHLYEQHLADPRKEFFVLDDTVLVLPYRANSSVNAL